MAYPSTGYGQLEHRDEEFDPFANELTGVSISQQPPQIYPQASSFKPGARPLQGLTPVQGAQPMMGGPGMQAPQPKMSKQGGLFMPPKHISSNNGAVYDTWFQFADTDQDGRLTGQDAVQFFERSGLPRDVLAKAWDMANSNRTGYLDRSSFHKAMDLLGLAQQGHEMSLDNYRLAVEQGGVPLPVMEGFDPETGMPGTGTRGQAPVASAAQYTPTPGQYTTAESVSSAGAKKWTNFGRSANKAAETSRKPVPGKVCTSIIDGLKQIYFQKVKPLEEAFKFNSFYSPYMTESDFDAKPSVLLMGQYSTGKTTLIKYLLGREYPGCNIGPEPTTDRFTAVYHGSEERRIPGNTLAVQPNLPYQGLTVFGTGFLTRFEGSQCPARLLEEITIVDTPGVLSGEKQRIERHYNFVEIAEWFASRCDLIFLLFDPHKLDISDEFKQVISCLRLHDDKVRIILNKADQLHQRELMRVYGALMWSLGKVFRNPEVCRVYIGSFNSEAPISEDKNPHGKEFFEEEQRELLESLYDIPQRSADRKINEFCKRVRACKIHMMLMGHMRKQMPAMWGKDKVQKKMMDDLGETFRQVQRENHLPMGDFPDVNRFREILSAFDISAFPKVSSSMTKQIDDVLSVDIPRLVKQFDNPW